MPNITNFISQLKSSKPFLLGNRYKVVMSKMSGTNFVYYCNKVVLPSIEFTQLDIDVGGHTIHAPHKMSLGNLELTFFNTGTELKKFHEWCDTNMYVHKTHAIGYYDDVKMTIKVTEYNMANEVAMTRTYTGCILTSLSAVNLSYYQASAIQEFTVGFTCSDVEIS